MEQLTIQKKVRGVSAFGTRSPKHDETLANYLTVRPTLPPGQDQKQRPDSLQVGHAGEAPHLHGLPQGRPSRQIADQPAGTQAAALDIHYANVTSSRLTRSLSAVITRLRSPSTSPAPTATRPCQTRCTTCGAGPISTFPFSIDDGCTITLSHTHTVSKPTRYVQAINTIGNIVKVYDQDQKFPVWGFGGKPRSGGKGLSLRVS